MEVGRQVGRLKQSHVCFECFCKTYRQAALFEFRTNRDVLAAIINEKCLWLPNAQYNAKETRRVGLILFAAVGAIDFMRLLRGITPQTHVVTLLRTWKMSRYSKSNCISLSPAIAHLLSTRRSSPSSFSISSLPPEKNIAMSKKSGPTQQLNVSLQNKIEALNILVCQNDSWEFDVLKKMCRYRFLYRQNAGLWPIHHSQPLLPFWSYPEQ